MNINLINKIRLLFLKNKKPYLALKKIIGFYPSNLYFYQVAFIHRSASHKTNDGRMINNERLEFLGDSILQSIVSDILFHKYPEKEEGFLTNVRSRIVKRETLNRLGIRLGLNKMIELPNGVTLRNTSILGNALEALVGAIYLDRGYEDCYFFIENILLEKYLDLDEIALDDYDFKSKLLEWGQHYHYKIRYEQLSCTQNKDNSYSFEMQVFVNNIPGGIGVGSSKKRAQQVASNKTMKMTEDISFLNKIKKSNYTEITEEEN